MPPRTAELRIHFYAANQSMRNRCFYSADGELLIVPQLGSLLLQTEFGNMEVAPGEICVIQRGIKFACRAAATRRSARLHLRELRSAVAAPRAWSDRRQWAGQCARFPDATSPPMKIATAITGWSPSFSAASGRPSTIIRRSTSLPGTETTRLTNMIWRNFNCINSVSFDHPDPSIYTVLTSPSEIPGTANFDFAIFPPRWLVAEHTFRPPWFHRNFMNEFMGLIHGEYDAKAEGFLPGGASLHNCMAGHGPDAATYERATRRRVEAAIAGRHAGLYV